MNRHPFLWVFLFNIYCMKYLKKLVDFFKSTISSKKDKNILKSRRRYRQGRWYTYDIKSLIIERCNPTFYFNGRNNTINRLPTSDNHLGSRVKDMSNLLLWKKGNNRDKILLHNLGSRINDHLDEKIFLNDILKICENKHLTIIAIDFANSLGSNSKQVAKVILREMDFEDGDGMPTDMIEYYASYLKSEFKNLRKKYFSEYNFSKDDRLYISYKNVDIINVHGVIEFKIEIGI